MTYSQAKACGIEHLWPEKAGKIALPEVAPPPSQFVSDGMNKTERRFSCILEQMKLGGIIRDWEFEPEKLRLADKTWFKPDFRVTLLDGRNVFVEVKVRKKDGSILWTDDGAVKVKTVPELHPYPLFLAAWGDRRWTIVRMPSRKWGWINVDIAFLVPLKRSTELGRATGHATSERNQSNAGTNA